MRKEPVLPPGLIKEFEAGQVTPAIGVMVKLARALGQRVGTFMDAQIANDLVITRSGGWRRGSLPMRASPRGTIATIVKTYKAGDLTFYDVIIAWAAVAQKEMCNAK